MNDTQRAAAQSLFLKAVAESAALSTRLPDVWSDLAAIADLCANALKSGRKILFCGNGGSAAECQHLSTEFVVRLTSDRNRGALPSIALTTDTSLLTACANDFGFDRVFARQVEAHLQAGDVLILLSTSGKSPNLIEAAKASRAKGGKNISFVGASATPLDEFSDLVLHVPSPSSQRVQEAHLFCGHLLVAMVEDLLYGAA